VNNGGIDHVAILGFYPLKSRLGYISMEYFSVMFFRPARFACRPACVKVSQVGIVPKAADEMKAAALHGIGK